MIKFFLKICQKLLLEGLPAEQVGKTTNYFRYAIRDILLVVIANNILCPFRETMLVDIIRTKIKPRAFRYEIYHVPKGTFNQQQTNLLPR